MPPLTESEFLVLAGKALDRLEADIEAAADAADADVEINRTGNVMELEFEDGSKIIVNSQAPMQELWVAAKAGGFHFRHDGAKWMDTRSGAELYAALSTYMSQQAGTTLTLG
ncbi:iron donor protein CyaY [Cupriavidus sp. 2KB_3]|uniref:iron donor protein CyaY n=1 Tax=Cupriavidus TaxID=106589 RepID=UPI0011F01438|nr:iron donor protein CyaY [Cupriavidus campinensis]